MNDEEALCSENVIISHHKALRREPGPNPDDAQRLVEFYIEEPCGTFLIARNAVRITTESHDGCSTWRGCVKPDKFIPGKITALYKDFAP